MTERSRPWAGIVTGDAGPYTEDNWMRVWASIIDPVIASQGVLWDQLNEFAASGVITPINIATGRAFVDGAWYESDAIVAVAIPTPGANPRIDRIVLRKDYALQTIRITRIAGAEGAAPVPPAITQVAGTTWDLPLWQIHVTVGAVVTVYADEREFVGQYTPAGLSATRFSEEDDMMGIRGSDRTRMFDTAIGANSFALALSSPNAGVVTTIAGVGGAGEAFWAQADGFVNLMLTLRPIAQEVDLEIFAATPATDPLTTGLFGTMDALPVGAGPVDPSDGIYFRQIAAGNWFAVTRVGAVETATDTGIVQSTTFRLFRIRCRAGIVNFYIDGVLVATHTTNLVASTLPMGIAMGHICTAAPAGSTNVTATDYVRVRGQRT